MFKKILSTAAMLAAITNAHAASTVPFGLTGTVTPAPCDVVLTIGSADLSASNASVRARPGRGGTFMPQSTTLPITIKCSTGIKVAMQFVDNFSGKNVKIDTDDIIRFGVVDGNGTTAIGAYDIQLTGVNLDNTPVGQFLTALNNTTSWTALGPTGKSASYAAPGYSVTFAKAAGATAPDSFMNFVGNLTVQAYLSAAYINNTNSSVIPNGSGTLAMVYL